MAKRRASCDASTCLGATRVSVRLVPGQVPSTRRLSQLGLFRRFYVASEYDNLIASKPSEQHPPLTTPLQCYSSKVICFESFLLPRTGFLFASVASPSLPQKSSTNKYILVEDNNDTICEGCATTRGCSGGRGSDDTRGYEVGSGDVGKELPRG